MSRSHTRSGRPLHFRFGQRSRLKVLRPIFEPLENRLMLDASSASQLPAAIVVGRTLATPSTAASSAPAPSYFVGEVQNNQVTITYTVYNEQADPETGVLLTTTLEPGVTLASSSAQPDESGQNLAWSLGTLSGFERATVSVTVNLANPIPSQLDGGASVYAMLDAGVVSSSTPAATLRSGNVSDPSLLASTPDANTNDPYVQEEAAALDYGPQQIFNFLRTQIGYQAYFGSVRGARGTLWSDAGNALDVASLGVALLRASGIPAQYVEGTLTQSDAQQLILSMFPPQDQTAGYIPAGAQVSDPANDPELLSETESHYWFQFDTGSGMTDADPLIPGATIGQISATSTGTFAEVPDSLREKTEVQLVAEITSEGLLGSTSSEKTVLDQTFNDVDLVGHPLTFGNFVSGQSAGFLITATTYTYTPYVAVGDDANPNPSNDETITGTPYQEVFSNFPFVSSEVTGLFLNVTLSGPQGSAQTYQKTLFDGIGYAVRQNGGTPVGSGQPTGSPSISPLEVWSMSVSAAMQDPTTYSTSEDQLQVTATTLANATAAGENTLAASTTTSALIGQTRAYLDVLRAAADGYTTGLAAETLVAAYASRPLITVISGNLTIQGKPGSQTGTLWFEADLLDDTVRVIAGPGQLMASEVQFRVLRGVAENVFETELFSNVPPLTGVTVETRVSTTTVMQAANAANIPIVTLTPDDPTALDTLAISSVAKARITAALEAGDDVIVPSQELTIDAAPTLAWWQVNPATGETTGVGEDGAHQSAIEYAVVSVVSTLIGIGVQYQVGVIAAQGVFNTLAVYEPLQFVQLQFKHDFNLHHGVPGWKPGSKQDYKREAIDQFNYMIQQQLNDLDFSVGPFDEGFETTLKKLQQQYDAELLADPPAPVGLIASPAPGAGAISGAQDLTAGATVAAGPIRGSAPAAGLAVSGTLQATWTGAASGGFLVTSLIAGTAAVRDASGAIIGSGAVSLSVASASGVPTGVSAGAVYHVEGSGDLSFYGSAATGLAVGADWENYSATVSGDVSLTLTSSALMLDAKVLAAGTYTITTSSAALAGSGPMTTPVFAGSVAVTTTGATVNLGAGSVGVSIAGAALNPAGSATLGGFSGGLTISSGGASPQATLSGMANEVVQAVASATELAGDQNSPASFNVAVQTSAAGPYSVALVALPGWIINIDANGNASVTPAFGTQSGTYPIEILAQSESDLNFAAQTFIDFTVAPTKPGLAFSVQPDPLTTIPYNGAQLPSAFEAAIQNLGPAADTYTLSFSNAPNGFAYLSGPTTVTVRAGQTGILGIYLVPDSGPLPVPGTRVSFDVTATSTTDPELTQTTTATLTVPEVDSLSVTATPTAPNTTPGAPVTSTLTVTNVGNVAETDVALTSVQSPGLTVTGLAPASLAVGQSTTETVTLTPAASTPLNNMLDATITATFGPPAAPATQTLDIAVNSVVPGAAAIADASVAASRLGNTDLAERLSDLSAALTNLVQNPTSDVYKGQALADVDSVVSQLDADPTLASFAGGLTSAGSALSAADSASTIQAAVSQLGNALAAVNTALNDVVASRFTLAMTPNSIVAQPQAPEVFNIVLQNTGSQTTTYGIAVAGLPHNVSAQLSDNSVTLQPGQEDNTINVTLTETGSSVSAAGFIVTVTPQGAPELAQSLQGTLTARADLVDVVSVDASPPFTAAGGSVDVTARVLNAVNQAQQAEASFTVTNAAGTIVFTSTPVAVSLGVLTQLSTFDLGTFATIGLVNGNYSINVTLTDASGQPSAGATGSGSLLVGTPVSASFAVSPATLPAGGGTITDTLTVNPNPGSSGGPLTLAGQVQTTPVGEEVALNGKLGYVVGTRGIDVVDVSNPADPKILRTFGQSDVITGASAYAQVAGSELIVASQANRNANGVRLLIYSLSPDPTDPILVSNTTVKAQFATGLFVDGNTVFLSNYGNSYSGSTLTGQFGNFVAIDISNPASPKLDSVLFNSGSAPNYSANNENATVAVTPTIAYVAGTTSTGPVPKGDTTTPGEGRVLIVNTTNPASRSLETPIGQLLIPGTNRLLGIAIDGDRALVVGSSDGYNSSGFVQGNITLTVLDITDPLNPAVLGSTLVTANNDPNKGQSDGSADGFGGMALALGGGLFAVSGTLQGGNPVIEVVNVNDPANLVTAAIPAPAGVHRMATANGELYATSADGLLVYNIGTLGAVPVTASVELPNGTGISVVAGSFNVAPTQVVAGTQFDTLVWNLTPTSPTTLTWQTAVNGLEPGESLGVTAGGSIGFVSQGTQGTLTLPPAFVTGAQIIGLDPPAQTVQPAAAATYTLTLTNPTSQPITYGLSVQGVPSRWVNLPSSVTVDANGTASETLTLTSDSFSSVGNYRFAVTAWATGGASQSVLGTLTLAGMPAVLPQTGAQGVVADLTPAQATAGQGTQASYVVQLTNTGSADDTFSVAALGLPTGVVADFGQSTIDVPPGGSNFRNVVLTLTSQKGTAPGTYSFTVTATSTADSATSGTTTGSLTVTAGGVAVTLNPQAGAPGSSFQATVTNTGTVADTFKLELGGPAALVASLAATQVTLAPGASQIIPVTTGAVNFAVHGALDLTAVATSATNPAIQAAATADLSVTTSQSMTAAFSPASQTLSKPGTASFTLMVHNTGNSEDAYSATIVGTNGPLTASLIGLDGSPTQSIAVFRLPALSTGAIMLQADLSKLGTGTVMVEVRSLTDGSIATTSMASVAAGPAVTIIGPQVATVERYGYHMMPTTLVLTFDQALDAIAADDPDNYQIIGPCGRKIRVKSAEYDPSTETVTLKPSQRINIHHRYTLIVDGASPGSITNTTGQFLDSRDGGPGSNYTTPLTWRNLVLDSPRPKATRVRR